MSKTNIAIVGGGMTATYLLKNFIDAGATDVALTIIEKDKRLGVGMPYDRKWVDEGHLANLSSQEIANTVDMPLHKWLCGKDDDYLSKNHITRALLEDTETAAKAIYPRVVLGDYFEERFVMLVKQAEANGIKVNVLPENEVTDIHDEGVHKGITLSLKKDKEIRDEPFDKVIIATGHRWPARKENPDKGYYASPWPASKLARFSNQPVGILGSSLTAVDTALTMARQHGTFEPNPKGGVKYVPNSGTENFKMTMHSRRGRLPYLRFDFEFKQFDQYRYVSKQEIDKRMASGTLTLDFFFQKFKDATEKKDPAFYDKIKDFSLEQFVEYVEAERKGKPFAWFKKEHAAATKSLKTETPLYWREVLLDVVYTMNFSIKHLPAEDVIRFQRTLLPLFSDIVAFLPIESADQLLALHEAGKLDIVPLGSKYSLTKFEDKPGAEVRILEGGERTPNDFYYPVFIEALGQQPMKASSNRFSFPFKGLVEQGIAQRAEVQFRTQEGAEREQPTGPDEPDNRIIKKGTDRYLLPGGIAVDDNFQLVDAQNHSNPRIFDIANSHIMGLYPFHEGLAFCNNIAAMVVSEIMQVRGPAIPARTQAALG